jgi:hypothetical protein
MDRIPHCRGRRRNEMAKLRQQHFYGLRCGTTKIEGKIPLTNGGEVGTVAIPGVKSVTKVSAGLFTVNLDEKYLGLAGYQANIQNSATDGYGVNLVSDAFVDGGEGVHAVVNGGDGYAQLQAIQPDGSGAAVLCNGMAIWFSLDLKTSEQG